MASMFTGVTLSTANYDALLIGWNSLPSLKNGVIFDARQNLINAHGWTITDGGQAN